MKERPILFSAPMVRAILDGSKTQTRRIVKPQPYIDEQGNFCWNGSNFGQDFNGPRIQAIASPLPSSKTKRVLCPYGKPGDRLWVRETWMDLIGTGIERTTGDRGRYAYRADTPAGSYGDEARKDYGLKWRPSIHMPRRAGRILLEITSVRVERLADLSKDDAMSEGIVIQPDGGFGLADSTHYNFCDPTYSFASLWESINGAGSWAGSPWVWVVEFQRMQA